MLLARPEAHVNADNIRFRQASVPALVAKYGPSGLGQPAISVSRRVALGRIEAKFPVGHGRTFRIHKAPVCRHCAHAGPAASVKNSQGKGPGIKPCETGAINPFAVGGSFGLPASRLPRQVLR